MLEPSHVLAIPAALLLTVTLSLCSCSDDTAPFGPPNGASGGAHQGGGAGSGGTPGSGGTAGSGGAVGASGSSATAGSGGTTGTPGAGATNGEGHVLYVTQDHELRLIEAKKGASPRNISAQLDSLSGGSDKGASLSPDGQWLSLVTTRFGCDDWECLAVVDSSIEHHEVIRVNGEKIHPENQSAVLAGGKQLVFVDKDGPHANDLYLVAKKNGTWTSPKLLTENSPYSYNRQPSVAADGARVVFDCGDEPYGGDGTSVCEASLTGSPNAHVVVEPDLGGSGGRLHSPSYTPSGDIVAEGEWSREIITRWARSSGKLSKFGYYGNDNTPCVLPDGRIASLWLGREGGSGAHELKIMSADGSAFFMLIKDEDLLDTEIGCGR